MSDQGEWDGGEGKDNIKTYCLVCWDNDSAVSSTGAAGKLMGCLSYYAHISWQLSFYSDFIANYYFYKEQQLHIKLF